ncbi:hypothetical protein E4T49_00442 [Aureobasidium sp. EXF-10728]|nr:hypothetical protein E4T49_00442 [Aureobasidium sp. EXF-10728]
MSGARICSQSCRTTAQRAVQLVRQYPSLQQQRCASSSSPSYHLDDLVSELPRSTRYSRPRQKPAAPVSRQPESLYDYVAAKSTPQQPARFPQTTPAQPNAAPKPQHHKHSDPPARDGPRAKKSRDASLISYTSNLEDLVARGDADAAWSYFSTHYTAPNCAALDPARLPFLDVPKHRKGFVYTHLLSLMTRHWLSQLDSHQSVESVTSLSPSAVLGRFNQLAIATPPIAGSVALSLAVHLQLASSRGLDVLTHPATKPVVLQLFDIWPLCFYPTKTDAMYYHRFMAHLGTPTEKPSSLALSLLLMQDLLCRATSFPDDLEQYRAPLQALDNACLKVHFNQAARHHIEMKLRNEFSNGVLESAELSKRLYSLRPASVLKNTSQNPSQADSIFNEDMTAASEPMDQKTRWLISRVSSAVEQQNLDRLEQNWAHAQEIFADESSRTLENAPSTLRLYEAFLHGFFQLRRPQAGLQVWNSMLQSGFEPTVRTWNVLMKGCHYSRDTQIMESMWQRMRDSGIQPDVVSWSTRVYGHFRVGSLRDGMAALEEMGMEWITAQNRRGSKSTVSEVPKPNTAILNSAIAALRGGKASQIPRVLAWSRSFDIEPDVVTYNALLAVSLSAGQATDAAKILQRMAASNIQPNSSTFTILVDSMLSTTLHGDMTQDEQKDEVMNLISAVEGGGMTVDVQGYALLIDRMLKDHNNLKAARSVLAHMTARKVACTPHIYTILMTHYFDANPPELLAADALWNDIQNSREHTMDVIFYDRMVEGFSRHGDVGRTMAFLNRMSKEGKRPGWLAMIAVVQCLARNHEWDRVGQIVMDCHKQEGLLSVGLRGKKGQKDFWEYVGRLAENELYGSEHGRDIFAIVEAQKAALGM